MLVISILITVLLTTPGKFGPYLKDVSLDGIAVNLVLGNTFLPASHGGKDLEDGWVQVPPTICHNTDDNLLP